MATTLLLTAMLALACLSSGTAAYYEAPPDADAAQALSVADLGPLQTLTDQQLSAVVAQEEDEAAHRVKRMGAGPSLSIVNPMDVLRQRLLLEIARRRLRDAEDQIQANRKLLASIGKRAVSDRSTSDMATEWDSSNPRWNDHFSTHQS